MQNKVGDNTPSTKALLALLENFKMSVEQLRAFCITLPADERKRLLHPRRGAELMMQRTHDLSVKYKVEVTGFPLDGMANDLTLTRNLQPFEDALRAGLTLAEDTASEAASEAWEAFLAHYAILSTMATRMPDLAAELQPVIDFMAVSKRRAPVTPPVPAK